MLYLSIKHIHISLAIASICLFCVRYYWALSGSALLQAKWVKILPHIIDTLLLSCGIFLMVYLQFWPNQHPWLMSKLIALVLYILFGTFAIKRGKTQKAKIYAGALAISTYIYMINVAISHKPLIIF